MAKYSKKVKIKMDDIYRIVVYSDHSTSSSGFNRIRYDVYMKLQYKKRFFWRTVRYGWIKEMVGSGHFKQLKTLSDRVYKDYLDSQKEINKLFDAMDALEKK